MTWSLPQIEFRCALASLAALCLSMAWTGAMLFPDTGRCLQATPPGALHCFLCWTAAVLTALAILPYPRLRLRSA